MRGGLTKEAFVPFPDNPLEGNRAKFLVICATAGYWSSVNTSGSLFKKYVYSSFSRKMVLNCIHIWSVDLFSVEDKVPERVFIGMQQ